MKHYEIAVVGNDTPVLALLPVLATRFSRIVWIHDGRLELPHLPAAVLQLRGECQFVAEHVLRCQTATGEITLAADQIILALGAQLQRPGWMIAHPRVVEGDCLSELDGSARHVTVVGMGATGRQVCAQLQGRVETIQCLDARPLSWEAVDFQLTGRTTCLLQPERSVIGMEPEADKLRLFLETGESLLTDAVVVCCGYIGNTAGYNLQAAGLSADDRGRLWCNAACETWTTGIYALGNVVGYPRTSLNRREQIQILMESLLTTHRPLPLTI